jgi:lipopolysaccharide transport system ATP-binding protein
MNDIAIRVENLSKLYRIGKSESYRTLRDTLTDVVYAPFRRIRSTFHRPALSGARGSSFRRANGDSTIWALKDVSFEVGQGEVVGIIGRNGAGKSTLLKILSRITEPTDGYAEIRGRVGSLLEVGTGFHPELTGRENIYLNGAILGMRKAEIEHKFDEIVAFAEIEKFIDTPVKHYSSGMYVRLAFAVAAHLEPEILIVDEVLAVGDARFQKKCFGKMQDVSHKGRTVLFVSHNMAAIVELCQRVALLHEGRVVEDGPVQQVVNQYMASSLKDSEGDIDLSDPSLRRNSLSNSRFKWTRVTILNSKGKPTATVGLAEPFEIVLQGIASLPEKDLQVGFGVMSGLGFPLFNSYQSDADLPTKYPSGVNIFRVKFDPNLFGPGVYSIDVAAVGTNTHDWIPDAIQLIVSEVDPASMVKIRANYGGVIRYPCTWSIDSYAA